MTTTETTAFNQLGPVELELIRVLEGGKPSGAYEDWGKADQYMVRVLSGEQLVSKWVHQAIVRHARDLVRSQQEGAEVFYSRKHAEHVLRWIAKNATITEDGLGVKTGDKLVLQPWQRAFISLLFGWRRVDGTPNGQRRFRNVYAELARGQGKALALDTPIPTPTGWKTQGSLEVGDELFDDAGKICHVTFLHPVEYNRPCYDLEFSDGTHIVADAEHEWYVESKCNNTGHKIPHKKNRTWEQQFIKTTKQIADSVVYVKRQDGTTEWNHRIPVCGPLDTPDISLPVDPYVLGAWLGDGTSACTNITIGDDDAAEMCSLLASKGQPVRKLGCAPTLYSFSDGTREQSVRHLTLQARLRQMNLIGNKHVPAVYLRASIKQRLELLRGLMDTDGSCNIDGQCEFTNVTFNLAQGVSELITSLGYKSSFREGRATIDGRDCGPKWRVSFYGTQDRNPFSFVRKATRVKATTKLSNNRQIVATTLVPSVPVRCITVDSPKSLYLAGESMIPTHNSKLASIIGLYILVGEKVRGSAVYSIATTMEQAGMVFNDAALMAAANKPDLRTLVRNKNLLYIPGTATLFRPLASNEHNLDGLKPNLIVVDELHAHRARGPWNKCKTAQGKKPGSMMLAITTAGYDRHSVCYEQRTYAENVVDGTYDDDSYFVWIAALEKTDDPFDPKNWHKANPNLGISIELQTLVDAAKQAQLIPTEYNEFLRLRCNIWTDSSVKWMPMDYWDKCNEVCDLELLKGRPCFGGMDMSTVIDISAFVLIFPPWEDDPKWRIVPFFFVPEDNVQERVKKDKVPYDAWIKKGLIIPTPGPVIDFDFIREFIVKLADTYDIRQVAYDPWNTHQLVTQLTQAGMKMVMMRQGFISLNSPMKTLLEKSMKGELAHGDNPVLRWMVNNTVAGIDPTGSIKPDKQKSTEKIDGLVATIMALGLAVLTPIKKKKKPFRPQVWS